jgi:hypothetical protein
MSRVWLYHINPKSRYGYTYGWDLERPETILRSRDRTWSAGSYANQVSVGDLICVFMKNLGRRPDGVHVVGSLISVAPEKGTFTWRPSADRSARTLIAPIPPKTIKRHFPRSYGHTMQPLAAAKSRSWIALLGAGAETEGVPRIEARGRPKAIRPPSSDPQASAKHGQLGEKHVLKILRERHTAADGFRIIHVSAKRPGADHDIAIVRRNRVVGLVEVKARVGNAGDPVLISEREIMCRRAHHGRHSIFLVYLSGSSAIREVIEIRAADSFLLKPQQHWLYPGME